MNPHLLIIIELAPEYWQHFELAGFCVHITTSIAVWTAQRPDDIVKVKAVLTNGSTGLHADEIAILPGLEIICAQGAGYENVDIVAAQARGIIVTHGPGTNDASVADHAIALLMAIARGIPQADTAVRRGEWQQARQVRPMVSGKKLGILGLGNIGMQIARRGEMGFGMSVAYHNRMPRADTPYLYIPTAAALAEWADFMVIATPGGIATRHIVDAEVLTTLGPNGFLINIARGSVVDTLALIDALEHHLIAGAALDVVEGEPAVPPELIQLANVILTPHIAGRSPEAIAATVQLVLDNLNAHFSGESVLTPVVPPGLLTKQ
ncbi:2-hydroxyacid dehydrogenase [Serratia sp. BIGb0163]|uniref:2-hydroxyacid dehydrogenase n=1 Tax=Serratia sp. BIGb0163 TaxID=2940613 RepID=UPI002169C269|nr:2-hydroxyacid dehydrogenase [Serratia sp. BIGb0163]MCS4265609.1 lactate dehydrogenase-like 2-hydroxyacid dehydrogenase [Serratia sp. BIGb0163]